MPEMGKRFQTVAAVTCMKTLLMVFNVIFFVTGIIFLAVGIWMKVSLNNILELSDVYSNAIAYVFIGTGTAIILVGSLGCWCTIKGQPILLYMFAGYLSVMFVLQLGAGIYCYAFRDRIKDGFHVGLNSTVYHYGHNSLQDKNLDLLQSHLGCCGIDNFDDWSKVPWAKTANGVVPRSCCRNQKLCHNGRPLNITHIYEEGCYRKVVNFVNTNMNIISIGTVGLAAFQLLGAILSCCLAKHSNKSKYETMA